MFRLLLCCHVTALTATVVGQSTFLYGGYRAGRYVFREGAPQNYAAEFNLGWEFGSTEDKAIIAFSPSASEYTITKNMEWGNLPHGISFGGVIGIGEYAALDIGFHQFSQKSVGERTNLSTNTEERFTLQSKSGGIGFNVVITPNEVFMPFIGLDFGHFRFRYSYEAKDIDIRKQSMGYKVHVLGGKVDVGDKPLYLGMNLGAYIRVLHLKGFDLKLMPQYQIRMDDAEELFMGLYQGHEFHHDNWSLSFLLTKDLRSNL